MALTEQQKAENKAAKKVRDRAYNARYRALSDALEEAEKDPELLKLKADGDALDARQTQKIEENRQKERDLQAQIDALRAQIELLRHDPEISAISQKRREAYDRFYKARDAKKAEVEAQFPDMQGHARFSAACWEPSQEVLEQMEEARRTATPENTAPKTRKARP